NLKERRETRELTPISHHTFCGAVPLSREAQTWPSESAVECGPGDRKTAFPGLRVQHRFIEKMRNYLSGRVFPRRLNPVETWPPRARFFSLHALCAPI